MKALTKAMCWELVSITKDRVNGVGIAVYRKPMSNECYEQRSKSEPPLCQENDDPNAAWYAFLHQIESFLLPESFKPCILWKAETNGIN